MKLSDSNPFKHTHEKKKSLYHKVLNLKNECFVFVVFASTKIFYSAVI
jgi:hypothetical protein